MKILMKYIKQILLVMVCSLCIECSVYAIICNDMSRYGMKAFDQL